MPLNNTVRFTGGTSDHDLRNTTLSSITLKPWSVPYCLTSRIAAYNADVGREITGLGGAELVL